MMWTSRRRKVGEWLAYLVCERARPVPRDALAEVVWMEAAPPSWETSLKALVSKLRPFTSGLAARDAPPLAIRAQYGCYQLELPRDAWVDVEAARASLDEAEGALWRKCPRAAWGSFNVAVTVARRGFLHGEDGTWVEEQRPTSSGCSSGASTATPRSLWQSASPRSRWRPCTRSSGSTRSGSRPGAP